MSVNIIVAIAENNVIGKDNTLIWHLPADLKYFKQLTTGNTVIMGRKTYDSIGKPLPNRRNVVITRNKDLKIDGCDLVNSLEEALDLTKTEENVFIIGGAQIYKEAMSVADKLYITEVKQQFDGDAFFPEIKKDQWEEILRDEHKADEKNKIDYSFVTYKRRN